MANENSRDPTTPKPQSIPLAKIHDLPGIPLVRQPDKSYGGLVTSIQSGGVKEPVIRRLREDGEYQLVTGYRRKRACEIMKKQEIPALVYEMSLQEAIRYHGLANGKPTPPIMVIPCRQHEFNRIPQSIHNSVQFCIQPASGSPNCLIIRAWCKILCKRNSTKTRRGAMERAQAEG